MMTRHQTRATRWRLNHQALTSTKHPNSRCRLARQQQRWFAPQQPGCRSQRVEGAKGLSLSRQQASIFCTGLTTDPQLACDVCLRDALVHERAHQISTLYGQLAREPGVLDRLCSDFLDTAE